MKIFMVFFDLALFLLGRGLAVASLASMIWFFAVESDRAQRRGLVNMRAYSQQMFGYDVQKKVERDRRLKRSNLNDFHRVFGKPEPY